MGLIDHNTKQPLISSAHQDGDFVEYRPGICSHQTGSLTDEELKAMVSVFKILSSHSLPSLYFWHMSTIETLQKKIEHLHPLNSFEGIVQNKELKMHFAEIVKKGGIIWQTCLNRFSNSLKRQKELENLQPHLITFVQKTNLDPNQVQTLAAKDDIEEQDVKKLLKSLIL